jgi:glycerophosphoryl diester phosphodiesterase
MSYAELSAFTINKTEKIPCYEDAARLCRELGLWANVEIKPAQGHERKTGEAVARMTRECWRGAPLAPLLSSFSIDALAAARSVAPELARGYLVSKIPHDWRDTMKRLACVALHCNYKSLTKELAAEIHGAGYAILLWTVNDPAAGKRMLEMGADCLVTDALDRIGPDFR